MPNDFIPSVLDTTHAGQTESFESALDRFIAAVQACINDHYAKDLPNSTPPTIEATHGTKYVRVVSLHNGVFCFVDKTNGNVLKADGWKRPHPLPRGTIYTNDFEKYGVNRYGAKYAK